MAQNGSTRLDKAFALSRTSVINDLYVNRLLTVLEARIGGIEGKAADFDEAAASLVELGLDRINEALIPAIDRLRSLVELGFLIAQSTSDVTVVNGVPTLWVIPEGPQREFFSPSPFVAAVRDGTPNDYAIIQTISYDKEHGEYLGVPLTIAGNPGPHNDWTLGALAGSTIAQLMLVGDAEDARDLAIEAKDDAIEAVTDVAEAREEVEDNREIVQTLAATYSVYWWGARNTPPPLVGMGAAVVGSQYLDTTGSPAVVRVWNGSSWAPTVTIALGGIRRQDFVAAAGPSLQGPYAVGGGFSVGDVFRNGVMLDDSDVTFVTGVAGTFTIIPALDAGDELNFRGYMSNDTVDSYTKAEADARYLKLSDTGVQGRVMAAAATVSAAQDAVGMSTYGKSLIALASAAALLTSLNVNAYVSANIFNKADAGSIRTELAVAPLASPGLTGTPTAPTAVAGTNNTQVATTAFVTAAVGAVLASAPAALDTLNELAAALGNDASFATTVTNSLALKAPLASPGLTGTPTAPTAAPGTNTTQIASTAFVTAAINVVLGGVSTAFDTLAELAAGLATKLDSSYFATTAEALSASSSVKALTPNNLDQTSVPLNLGAALTGNLTLDLSTFFHAYGTATGNIVFNAVSNTRWRGGVIEIAASGADRTVGFNTAAFCTPGNASLGTILSGQTMAFAWRRLLLPGKILLTKIGVVS